MKMPATWLLAGLLARLAGCGATDVTGQLDVNQTQITQIVQNTSLSLSERRAALADLGLSETTINAVLRGERLGNQFGGDLESAFEKITGGSYSTLTPDEIQAYGDASALATLTDEAAQRIATFFLTEPINTADQLEEFLDDAGRSLPSGIDATELRDIFVDFDPDDVIDDLP
jgi:hypothetical protein